MRATNHVQIKQLCKSCIPALMLKFSLGTAEKILTDSEGWVNPCFFVNDRWALRFNARDPVLPKYQREKRAFALLTSLGIPGPRKVLLDETKEFAPFDVLITEMVPGTNAEAGWKTFATEQRHRLAENAGQWLSKIHDIEFPFFGELGAGGPFPRTTTWFEFLTAKVNYHLNEGRAGFRMGFCRRSSL